MPFSDTLGMGGDCASVDDEPSAAWPFMEAAESGALRLALLIDFFWAVSERRDLFTDCRFANDFLLFSVSLASATAATSSSVTPSATD